MSFTDYDLRVLGLGLTEALEGTDGNFDNTDVHMEKLLERIKLARRRLARRAQ